MVKMDKVLVGNSFLLLVTFNIFNLLNFVFQISMARLLTLAEYGTLSALFFIVYASGIFSESVQTVLAKYSSIERNLGKTKQILRKALDKSWKISLFLLIIYLGVAFPLSGLLKIEYGLIALTGLMIFAAFLTPVTRGVMQGRKVFGHLGINMIIEASVKLVLGVLLVWWGWSVYGAITATILGAGTAFVFSFLPLKNVVRSKEEKVETPEIYNYTKPVFVVTFIILIFYSIDIFIAKIVFPSSVAGAYAIASTIAKVIFVGTYPISKAMFPLSSENESKKVKREGIFRNSFSLLVVLLVVGLIIVYFFAPLLVRIFSGREVGDAINILFYLSIATTLISLANLNLLYKLSVNRIKGYPYLLTFIVIEVLLLVYFSANLIQFSMAFVTASAFLLWGSIYFLK